MLMLEDLSENMNTFKAWVRNNNDKNQVYGNITFVIETDTQMDTSLFVQV